VTDFTRCQDNELHNGQITAPAAAPGHDPWSTWTPNQWTLTADDLPLDGRQVLVFIHGFGTSFESAVQSAVRLAWHMKHGGHVLVYSWASWGSLLMYRCDQWRVKAAVQPLRDNVLQHFDSQVSYGNPTQMWACARLDIQNCSQPVQITQHDMRIFQCHID
jgi:esterase/lipase superfamily enzyme